MVGPRAVGLLGVEIMGGDPFRVGGWCSTRRVLGGEEGIRIAVLRFGWGNVLETLKLQIGLAMIR